MKWQDKLQRRLGGRCIPGLSKVLAYGQLAVWLVVMIINYRLYDALTLTRAGLAGGQIWRAVGFLFLPTDLSLWGMLSIYLLYYMGSALEAAWGDFRVNLYWAAGLLGSVAAALLTGYTTNYYLVMSQFLAFAWLYPDMELLLMFILPVKVKYLGWVAGAMLALNFLGGSMAEKIRILCGLAGFIAFFGPAVFSGVRAWIRREQWRRQNRNNWRR